MKSFVFILDEWKQTVETQAWRPPTDVYEKDGSLIIRLEAAGMREDQFSVTCHQGKIQVRGKREDTACKDSYHAMEIPFGEFKVEVVLPEVLCIHIERIRFWYENGFLYIHCPRALPKKKGIAPKTEDNGGLHGRS